MLEVWNKIDFLLPDAREGMMTQSARTEDIFATSAITGEGIDALLEAITEKTKDPRTEEVLHLGFGDGKAHAWLFEQGVVTADAQTEDGYRMKVFWSAMQKERFSRLQ
jgi:GTP-binding protein HflX